MTIKPSHDGSVIVDYDYYWLPIDTCPIGSKVQLLGEGGVAVYGIYRRGDTFWTHWCPLPKLKRTCEKENT